MTKKPESRKVEPPKPDPKKFIVAFLPRRDKEKIQGKNRRPVTRSAKYRLRTLSRVLTKLKPGPVSIGVGANRVGVAFRRILEVKFLETMVLNLFCGSGYLDLREVYFKL